MSTNSAPGTDKRASRLDRRWVLIGLVLAAVLVVTVLGVYAFVPRGSSGASGTSSDLSPYDQLRAQVGPNGEVTRDMALQAFSLAIAPLPGVSVPTGAPPNLDRQADATFAVLWTMRYLDQLTPEQHAVVDPILAADPTAPRLTPQPAGNRRPRVVFAADTTASDYLDLAEMYENEIASELGRQLSMSVSLQIDKLQTNGKNADWLAYSVPVGAGQTECALHVEPLLQSMNDTSTKNATMAHEMFHCFQFDWARQHGVNAWSVPDWIIEGQAEWAGENLGGPSKTGAEWWLDYLLSPQTPLFARDYAAVGFYQHLAEEQINPWTQFDNMLAGFKQTTNVGAYQGAGAENATFLDTWASGNFKDSSLGLEWNAQGPWKVTANPPIQTMTIGANQNESAETEEVRNLLVNVVVTTDILHVTSDGHVRLRAPGVADLPTTDRWLCFDFDSCTCPPNKVYEGPSLSYVTVDPNIAPTAHFGLTGGLTGADLLVSGHDLDEFCKPRPSAGPTQAPGSPETGCMATCPDSNGDPHLRTVNGYRYDFQAAGEFVLLRSADASVEIQARQEPYTATSHYRGLSTNTAIAALDNGHRVSVYSTENGLTLHVDGQQVDPSSLPDLGAGASVKQTRGGYEIDFPDGTVLWTLSLGTWGINAIVQPSDLLRSGGTGLIGVVTPGGMGVPLLPDGTQLPPVSDFDARHAVLYGQFADAWRVSDATSLFDYDAGTSTASYTDHNFPSDADDSALAAALASPDPTQQAAAQTACSALTDADLLANCEFDVYATGDAGFARQYAAQQNFYDTGIAPSAPPPSFGAVTGAQKVVELQDLDGATIGPDNTIYVSITDSSGTAQLVAIDPTTSAIKQQVPIRVATGVHFAAGSVWMAGQAPDANGHYCTVTRYDPTTLATQGDYQLPCPSSNPAPPGLTSMGDAVWFVDTSRADPSTGAGTVLTQIDPTTNAPAKSVPLGYAGNCCIDSQGALFCYCGNSDVWRLTGSDSSFIDLGSYNPIYAAGTGFWSAVQQVTDSAGYIAGPGGPSAALPLNDERIVGGDPTGVYLESSTSGIELYRQPADGSAAVKLATAPVSGSGIDETDYDYSTGGFPWFATPQGYAHLWEFKETPNSPLALWLQWAPLP